jgi:hypothetical protein
LAEGQGGQQKQTCRHANERCETRSFELWNMSRLFPSPVKILEASVIIVGDLRQPKESGA